MKIMFLGVSLEQIDQLCKEEEIVKVSISTFKREVFAHPGGEGDTLEEVQTGGWGRQIMSSKDLIEFVADNTKNDDYGDEKEKAEYSDKVREKYR